MKKKEVVSWQIKRFFGENGSLEEKIFFMIDQYGINVREKAEVFCLVIKRFLTGRKDDEQKKAGMPGSVFGRMR